MGCWFNSHWHHCFNSLMALDKLLTTNVHPLDPGDEWVPGQVQFFSTRWRLGVTAPQGGEMVYQVRYKGQTVTCQVLKSCETYVT